MAKNRTRQPVEWIAWVAVAFGWLCSASVQLSGGPEQRVVSIVPTVMVVIATIMVAATAVTRKSSALSIPALVTSLLPLLILFASFISW